MHFFKCLLVFIFLVRKFIFDVLGPKFRFWALKAYFRFFFLVSTEICIISKLSSCYAKVIFYCRFYFLGNILSDYFVVFIFCISIYRKYLMNLFSHAPKIPTTMVKIDIITEEEPKFPAEKLKALFGKRTTTIQECW
jgi:hypothetical protein